ncbi:unnamed protein product [Zymoseptoria tritici ST99CH_3D7]|uniref:Uncharacterized protein n=1 Tax=Zymoseptoria tritici (strain ST99CH_3D7) TaxID=1276538 RepID=A0A1X7S404_ZYMT9|nr:unnamed protein product [Zymoseptoria tritici ST99CH_3D7]
MRFFLDPGEASAAHLEDGLDADGHIGGDCGVFGGATLRLRRCRSDEEEEKVKFDCRILRVYSPTMAAIKSGEV